MTQPTTLLAMLDETPGIVGAWLCTASGVMRRVIRGAANRETEATRTAALAAELTTLGSLLGLRELRVASIKAPTSGRVVARQPDALLAIELDPRRSLGDLERKLATLTWAISDCDVPPVSRATTGAPRARGGSTTPPTPESARSARGGGGKPTRPPPVTHGAVSPHDGATATNNAVFAGDLEEFCIADLLQLLRNSHRTGLLTCTTRGEVATVQLSRGMIVGADSPHALDLRQYLLSTTEIAPEQRRAIIALPVESFRDDTVDHAVVSRNLVAPADMERARIAHIYSALREMCGWTSGRFSFDPSAAITASPRLALSMQNVLLHLYDDPR